MTIKSWMLDKVHRMNGVTGRPDLPPSDPSPSRPRAPAPESALAAAEHLGPYAALIGSVREELEHFVASHVRLHLAIADHDRFLLTSIGVTCPGAEARALLQQFMREFKPEQVKRYLAREVIAGLPNASAIDLSQFAGLVDPQSQEEDDDEYADLIDALRGAVPSNIARPYQVSIVGRWSELDVPRSNGSASMRPSPTTPLAGLRCEFELDDGEGRRRVVLQSVVPGRRYVVGKDEGCDIRVAGTYTSRRHGELWMEQGGWWVADAGSTNGIRVEGPGSAVARSGGPAEAAAGSAPIRLGEGARIVLSAQAQGPASDYPWLALRTPQAATRPTPLAATVPPSTDDATDAAPNTPITPIVAPRPYELAYIITACVASGERTLELRADVLPMAVGRSRNQRLVVDRAHEAVSGHHLDITEIDESGAQVVVHGDNGVMVDGVTHVAGTRFRWRPGETMVLGGGLQDHPACALVLSRR